MRRIKSFEEYLKEGIVRKVTPDVQRAENLFMESKRKYVLLQKIIKHMGIDNENANEYLESCYNIILFVIRGKMLLEGYYASGTGAHEAEVSYAKNISFSEKELEFLDQLRYFRNGILYYGKRFEKDYAQKVINFLEAIYQKLQR
ncbi:MAG: hypothetical protein QT08_C0008G0056 [archaeon GW2011_AR17]|nr:MAG: hypothetical protein QT08_C0008G0056 [archaeon GW2011_AR17]MBS3153818.1 hypothetical protein [Candidatus Woesearchaeota archaeon]HIH15156.1 hypothetical protein [Nanoarchaeota archaeon]HIH59422.1 hypothetical protein [Nanoarchaeota archaeon]HII13820.1 hypothetical protein [Nanoarchaeota archaeon]